MKEKVFYQVARGCSGVWASGIRDDLDINNLPPLTGVCTLHIGQMDGKPQITIANCEPRSWYNDEPGPEVDRGSWEKMYEMFLNYARLL